MGRFLHVIALASFGLCAALSATMTGYAEEPAADDKPNYRRPTDDEQLRQWLTHLIAYPRYSLGEVHAATGMQTAEIKRALARFKIRSGDRPRREPGNPLVVLPYPGGRHPRIGFLDGAVRPQRETKVSVFTPWDPDSYVVADVPEAIWSNLGLTYLAHTHVPTVWTKVGIELEPLEWKTGPDQTLVLERTLPNGIRFRTEVVPKADAVRMAMSLTNGTAEPLSDLRVQNCVMFKGAAGFESQTNDNKVFDEPYAACRSDDGQRWVITAWTPCHRPWGNAPCPCLHSDPIFPDCPPGKTVRVAGWLSFYEGTDIQGEFRRIEATGWRD